MKSHFTNTSEHNRCFQQRWHTPAIGPTPSSRTGECLQGSNHSWVGGWCGSSSTSASPVTFIHSWPDHCTGHTRRSCLALVGLQHLLDLLVPLVVFVVRLRHHLVLLKLLLQLLLPVCWLVWVYGEKTIQAGVMRAHERQHLALASIETLRALTVSRGDAVLLIQHQLLHLFPQVFLVDGRLVESVAHKLRNSGTCRHLLLFLLRWLGDTRTGKTFNVTSLFKWLLADEIKICIHTTHLHFNSLTFCMSPMETGGVFGLTLSTKNNIVLLIFLMQITVCCLLISVTHGLALKPPLCLWFVNQVVHSRRGTDKE